MKNRKAFFLLLGIVALLLSCKSQPKITDPDMMPPDQELLDTMNTAMTRAATAREQSLAVNGRTYFPEKWAQAESDNDAAKGKDKETTGGVNEATTLFTQAAETWEGITEDSGPLYAKDMEEIRLALDTVTTRAGKSRQDALDNQGPSYFPDDWEAAETKYQSGENAPKEGLDDMRNAVALYTAAADGFDDIAERSRPLFAQERESAMAALQEAMARADQSRKAAQDAQGATHFPDDWRTTEAALQAARNAKRGTLEEIRAAGELFASAADAYDDLAERSRPLAARGEAQRALNAAIARAEKSRQDAMAVDGQTYFASDWRNAESRNQAAGNAKRDTAEEMTAATALYVAAADAYDDIANRSRTRFTQDRDAASKALQDAVTRAQQSRRAASDARAQTNFPNEWRDAEAKNQAATNARRGTIAEMRAAVPLYNTAADAYDAIVRRTTARAAEENERAAVNAKERADKERQAAIAVRAPVAAPTEFNRAEILYQQAVGDMNSKTFAPAAERFNQSAQLFTAAAQAAETKRGQAEAALARARERSAASVALATSVGQAMEEEGNE